MGKKEKIESEKLAPPYAPYSHAMKVSMMGALVFVSGIVPNDIDGKIYCPGDIKSQAKRVIELLKITLEAAGATIADVVKLTTYVTDMSKYLSTKTNFEYLSNFNCPSETLVEVKSLAHSTEGQMIEVEAIAVIG